MPHRYFTTEISDGTATLRGADAHHLARVMRARLGDTVILCDGNAVEYTATITGFGDECVEFRVEPGYPSAAEPSVEVTLLAGYPKQDKLEQIIKHGVELGAAHIVPFFSRYCVAAPKKEEQKNERYNRIAVEAAKQCGRGVLPDVALPLANFGAVCRTFAQYDLVLFCYECGGAPLRDLLAAAKPADGEKLKIAIVTGAEGGFAAEEAEMAAKAGARTVGLGPRILRCETAPLAVLAAVIAALWLAVGSIPRKPPAPAPTPVQTTAPTPTPTPKKPPQIILPPPPTPEPEPSPEVTPEPSPDVTHVHETAAPEKLPG